MRKTLIASAIIGILSVPAIAFAEDAPAAAPSPFTGNMNFASEYLYRGIAQTRGNPALQGGFDYAHPSGFYIGTWGSNISWVSDTGIGNASLEWDVYGGYKGTAGPLGYDVGLLTYNYPGNHKPSNDAAKPDTKELYGALTWEWLTIKYSYSLGSLFGWTKNNDGHSKTTGSGYLEANAAYDLGNGWGVTGHAGHQSVKGYGKASYADFKVGGTKDIGYGVVGAGVSTTNAKDSCNSGEPYCLGGYEAGKPRLYVTFGKTF
jgi:uncharacterized protein (TIGR02001 family)